MKTENMPAGNVDALNELETTDAISELVAKTLTIEEKILQLEANEARAELINWINTDPEVKIIIAFSGGKDSVYMVLYYLFVLKVPADRIELWHHDVDGHGEQLFDWKVTPDYCRAFAQTFGLKLLFSYRKGGIVKRLLRWNEPRGDVYYQIEPDGPYHCIKSKQSALNTGGRWPAIVSDLRGNERWCSGEVKIDVAATIFANDARLSGTKEKPSKIVFNTGERHDESTARLSLKEMQVYRGKTFIQNRHVLLWRPNVEVTERQVWELMKTHGVQAHPCYMIGWNRCSCQLCIFNANEFWRTLLDISPEKVLRVRELEEATAAYPINNGKEHTLYNQKTIFEKAILGGDGIILDYKDPEVKYWIKQATEKFDHPIVIDNWVMPKGALTKLKCGAT